MRGRYTSILFKPLLFWVFQLHTAKLNITDIGGHCSNPDERRWWLGPDGSKGSWMLDIVLKVGPIGFADGLDTGVREGERLRKTSGFCP